MHTLTRVGVAYLLLCQAITMSRCASSLDRKEVRNSLLPPLHSISIELGKPQCLFLRTLVTSCNIVRADLGRRRQTSSSRR